MGLGFAGRVLLCSMKLRTSMPSTVQSTSPTATETVHRIIRYRLYSGDAEPGSALHGNEKVNPSLQFGSQDPGIDHGGADGRGYERVG